MVYAGTGCIESLLYLEDGLVTRCERLFPRYFSSERSEDVYFFRYLTQGLVNVIIDRFNSDV